MIPRAVRVAAAAATWLALAACARAQSPSPLAARPLRADTARLHRALDSLAAAHRGVVGYSVRDLSSGAVLSLRGE